MAFLDNSGDILLDAVLTDTGRFRMARGDFRITKFALGDDEIDYSLYNKNHPSGSAFYDLEVLKTPILEAFTNNTSGMKSKLMSISRTNILHLPVMKLHNGGLNGAAAGSDATKISGDLSSYLITVDANTEDTADSLIEGGNVRGKGLILGSTAEKISSADSATIAVELGLDTLQLEPNGLYPSDLQETQFIFELDSRLASLVDADAQPVSVSFIDDDQVASYFVGAAAGSAIVQPRIDGLPQTQAVNGETTRHRIRGPRDKVLFFKIAPTPTLANSTYLFERLGSTLTTSISLLGGTGADPGDQSFRSSVELYFIDSFIKVTAATVGVSIDIPIRFLKKKDT
tara:strand:- start:1361 stop:2389 length:1029 start_codon:yes stop_codon:yes gene_type:complete